MQFYHYYTYQVIIVSYFVNVWTFGGNNNIQIVSHEQRFIGSRPVNVKVTLAERWILYCSVISAGLIFFWEIWVVGPDLKRNISEKTCGLWKITFFSHFLWKITFKFLSLLYKFLNFIPPNAEERKTASTPISHVYSAVVLSNFTQTLDNN